jgi:hypothetical protein|tara:strand:- start:7477 stop:10281 length:2805 start_codon:yes stop_codon:yes gene_type:complete
MTDAETEAALRKLSQKLSTGGRGSGDFSVADPEKGYWEEAGDWLSEIFTGSEQRKDLEARGISVEGAPVGMRASASFNPKAEDKAIDVARQLMEEHGSDVDIKVDHRTNRLKYKHPKKGWIIFDPPGMDMGDWTELAGELPAMTLEGLTYWLSRKIPGRNILRRGPKRDIALKGTAIATGGAAGEAGRVKYAQETGMQDHLTKKEKEEQMVMEPLKAAGLGVAGGVAGRATGGGLKWVWQMASGKRVPAVYRNRLKVFAEQSQEPIELINDYLKKSGIDKKFSPTPSQVLRDPELHRVMQNIINDKSMPDQSKLIIQAYMDNYSALKSALDEAGIRAVPLQADEVSELSAGTALKRELEAPLKAGERAVALGASNRSKAAREALEAVEATAGHEAADMGAGASYRDLFEKAVQKHRDRFNRLYSELSDTYINRTVRPTTLRHLLKKELALYEKDLAEGSWLVGEDQALFEKILKNVDTARISSSGANIRGAPEVDLPVLDRFIKQLKAGERKLYGKDNTGPALESIKRLREAAEKDFARGLADMGPEAVVKKAQLDELYKAEQDKLARGTVAKMIKIDADGMPRVTDEKMFNYFFGRDVATGTRSKHIHRVLSEPQYHAERKQVENTIFQQFIRENSDPVTDKLIGKKAKNWLDQRKQNLDLWFSPQQQQILRNAETSASAVKRWEQREKNFQKALKHAYGATVTKYGREGVLQPEEVFKKMWDNPIGLERMKSRATKFPNEWDMFRKAGLKRIEKDITAYDKNLEADVINFDKLNKILDDQDYMKRIRVLYGDQYLKDLRMIREGAQILDRDIGSRVSKDKNGWVAVVRNMVFGPLSHKNFAYKKGSEKVQQVQLDNLKRLLLDTDQLRKVANDIDTSEGTKHAQTLLGAGGAQFAGDADTGESYRGGIPAVDALADRVKNDKVLQEKIRAAQ